MRNLSNVYKRQKHFFVTVRKDSTSADVFCCLRLSVPIAFQFLHKSHGQEIRGNLPIGVTDTNKSLLPHHSVQKQQNISDRVELKV